VVTRVRMLGCVSLCVGLAASLGLLGIGQEILEITAWKATTPIKIDGSLEEWNTSSPIKISQNSQLILGDYLWGGSYDLSAVVYIMWDDDYLYIGAEVQDDVPFTARPGFKPDDADSIGIYISTNPNADPKRTKYEPTDFRILLMTDGYEFYTAIDRDMIANRMGIETAGMYGDEQVILGFEAAVTVTRRGYILEAKIPFAALSNESLPKFVPQDGLKIKFNVELNDIDMPCPGIGAKTMAWVGSAAIRTNPSEWGFLVFKSGI